MVIWNGDACDIRPKSGSMIWFQNNKKRKNMQEKKSQFFNNSQDYKQINNKKKIHVLLCHGTTKTRILLDKWALYYC